MINFLFWKNINPISLMFILIFLYPILKGFLFKFSSKSIKEDIQQISANIAFIIAFFLGIYFTKSIFIEHEVGIYKKIYEIIPQQVIQYFFNKPTLVYIIILPIMILLLYKIISVIFELINRISFYVIFDLIESSLEDSSSIFKRIIGSTVQLPKSICYVLILAFVLNIISMFNVSNEFNAHLQKSSYYNYLCKEIVIPVTNSRIARQLPNIINNSFKIIVVKEKDAHDNSIDGQNTFDKHTIVYYNGVTLDQGVTSNKKIDEFARSLVNDKDTTRTKAKIIYKWIGRNIEYDHNKAMKVLNNDMNVKSGAINAFNTGKGICFDYSCLFVAMCRANNIKTRLITGQGFNGVSWVSHAWNQVYLDEEKKWINVDTTFYKGGNYFDSTRFAIDHKQSEIAGEW